MSWHFSQALVEGFLAPDCWDGERYAQLKSTLSAARSSPSVKTIMPWGASQCGTMLEPSTGSLGVELLTWFLAAFPARNSVPLLEEEIMQMTSGRRCDGSWQMSLLDTSSPRTCPSRQSRKPQQTSMLLVTSSALGGSPPRSWAQTTFGKDIGCVHTPTTKANYTCKSMQKWRNCRAFTRVFGRPTPEIQEYLMGWPIGWTALKPLETASYLKWLSSHGEP